jgi:hypothetical protein
MAGQQQQTNSAAPRRTRLERRGMRIVFPDIGGTISRSESIVRLAVAQLPLRVCPMTLV